ncbi:MAG: RnfABCDGE type electron transport complex subunit A [Candidatus Omnitrophica bacterium]|nr:RnfABCDGE type electron transport complex subunit A [Candidatus Omnitrophota bacterium]MBU4478230.1 RnfABCDGE type electron transport complex subunit A [Candidatus Omnitrophota bacterium]MCG2703297.1 RnfABCDGE type electron transport complex subunit A [Candidatus Omnitrophota bacterium]
MDINIARLAGIVISAVFVNNFVLSRFLGLCPFIGISKKLDVALGMGISMTFVVTMSSMLTWPIYHFVLIPHNLQYLNIITFILVIACFVQLVEVFVRKFNPVLYKALGIYLPLITCNCVVLFVTLLNAQNELSFLESTVQGFSAGVGFAMALILMTSIRERLAGAPIPEFMKGAPIAFIIAGLMSFAFLGFSGLMVE